MTPVIVNEKPPIVQLAVKTLPTVPLHVSPLLSDTENDVPSTEPVNVSVAPLSKVIVMDALGPLRIRTGWLTGRATTERSEATVLDPVVVVIVALNDPTAAGLTIPPT